MKKVEELQQTPFSFHPIKAYLLRNRLFFLLMATALCLFSMLIYRIRYQSEKKRGEAEKEYKHFTLSHDPASLDKLIALVEKNSFLKQKYDLKISQALVEAKQKDRAYPFFFRSLGWLEQHAPGHAQFARIGLLLEESSWERALAESALLKAEIAALSSEKSALYAFNLIRMAFLCQKLELASEESCCWQELGDRLAADRENKAGRPYLSLERVLSEAFQEKGVHFNEYMAARKEILSLK